jgi:hypothetical protein
MSIAREEELYPCTGGQKEPRDWHYDERDMKPGYGVMSWDKNKILIVAVFELIP